jgi:hypothetical protein
MRPNGDILPTGKKCPLQDEGVEKSLALRERDLGYSRKIDLPKSRRFTSPPTPSPLRREGEIDVFLKSLSAAQRRGTSGELNFWKSLNCLAAFFGQVERCPFRFTSLPSP